MGIVVTGILIGLAVVGSLLLLFRFILFLIDLLRYAAMYAALTALLKVLQRDPSDIVERMQETSEAIKEVEDILKGKDPES